MLPLSLINLAATTLEVFLLPESGATTVQQWIMVGINLPLALVCVPLFGRLMQEKARPGFQPGCPQGGAGSSHNRVQLVESS